MRVIQGSKQQIGSAIDAIKQAVPEQLKLYVEISKLQKGYYDELIKAGFSESQALHIVTIQGFAANGQPSNS